MPAPPWYPRGMLGRVIIGWLAVLIAVSAWAVPGDTAIRQAQQAYEARKAAELERAAREVPAEHVLAPYVEFWRLMLTNGAAEARIADFLARYPGSRMAEALRADWLKSLGAREAWAQYLAEYPRLVRPEPVHQCYAHRAEWAQGNRSRLGEAVALWFTGRDLPSACTPLFARMISEGILREEDLWRRLRLAFEAGNPNVARVIAQSLPEPQRPQAALIDLAQRMPARALASASPLDTSRRGDREVALYALDLLARRDSVEAERALRRWAAQLKPEEVGAGWAHLATWAARRHEPAALAWFLQADAASLTDFQREWWARAALRGGDWPTVRTAIEGMSETARAQPVWRYWRARALAATGQRIAANAIFLPLSREHHYYGQLAQEELGPVAQTPLINVKTVGEVQAEVSRHPGIMRAVALYELGLRQEATQEWNWTIREFSDPELLAAAELARRMEWYDRAIYTAERTRDVHDFELRFIAPYRDMAQKAARENGIDEALVFGLMRQESRFVSQARSRVGAAGLMQIMPATARWIAQRLGIKGFQAQQMQEPARNIQFGAYYLRHVQDRLDGSPVLATAAYNAGPGRAQRWRDAREMEAAVYIETIPFSETRDYVKKVMSNAMYYAARFGQQSVLLKERLGTVPPRTAPATPAAEPDSGENGANETG